MKKRIIAMLLALLLSVSLVLTEGAVVAEAAGNKKVVEGYSYNLSGKKVAKIRGYEYIIPEEGKVLWEAYGTDTYLNARNTKGEVSKKIDQGERFWVFGVFTKNTNRLVVFHEGTICTVYIPDTAATGNTLWYEGKSYQTTNSSRTNLRAHDYQLIKSVPAGQEMEVVGSSVYRPTRNVVISGKDIGTVQKIDLADSKETNTNTNARRFVRSTGEWNLRKRTGNREVIQLTYPGEVFEVICKDPYDPSYSYVVWNGIEATIYNSGFKEIRDVPEFKGSSYHGYNSYGGPLTFRAKDWNTVIGEVPANASFYVLGDDVNNKYRVVAIYDGRIGTLMKSGVSKVSNGVFVNKTRQMVTLYRKGKFIANSPCITGEKGKADTPIGTYYIYYKENNRYLSGTNWKGKKYNSFVYNWLPFEGGYGLHDATWCSEFGGDLYDNGGGSNGCVRLPLEFAGLLYANAYIGMPVIICK